MPTMPLTNRRDVLPYPPGTNASFTVVNGMPLNKTALIQFGYTVYSNNTVSNETQCYLVFDAFKPTLLGNGTWLDATTCYIPYYNIGTRGILNIIFGALFGITIVLSMINLRKHGKRHLRESKRFRAVGRRWQWYWMLFVAACGMISTLTGVDVDRYYLQDLPIILQSFFFALMMPGTLAMVWEATRHWASWQGRQICDEDPFLLPQHDHRAKTEFWLPLVFYLFAFLHFFMVIPRSWSGLKQQSTEWQVERVAKPRATGSRDKAGAVLACCACVVTCYSLWHSMKHYKQSSWLRCPPKLAVAIVLLGTRLGYGIVSAWDWNLSISKIGVQLGWSFGLGYGPILLILLVFEVAGFLEENEDRALLQQRVARGQIHDAELNIIRKPAWWQKNVRDRYLSDEQRLKQMSSEIGGGRATTNRIQQDFEMRSLDSKELPSNEPPSEDPFRDESPDTREAHSQSCSSESARTGIDMVSQSQPSNGTGRTFQPPPQQQTHSMLDV